MERPRAVARTSGMIHLEREGELGVLELRHPNALNPFTRAMTRELASRCAEAEEDERIAGLLVWGGPGRSFSVGGDFRDLRALGTPEEVGEYLRDIVRSYQALLRVSKPVVCAVDGFAIGQGLQVALLGDWRIGTERSRYRMPELANGMPCPLGSALLESFFGRAAMLHLVVGCAELAAEEARARGLVDELRPHAELGEAARARLAELVAFPSYPFRATKRIHNERLVALLEDVREEAARVHAESYVAGHAERHFTRVVGSGE